jgi:hypothetical protein
MEEELFCIGCGAKIQTEHSNELGYTPLQLWKKA